MSRAALKIHFHNEETLRNLERVAEELGASADELAEAAIERELAAVGGRGTGGRLAAGPIPFRRSRRSFYSLRP